MADLTDLQASGTTKIVGSDSAGVETNPLNVDSNGNLKVGLTSDGTNVAAVTAPSTAAVASDRAIVVAISPNTAISTNNNQGTPNTLANAWPVKITDGTDVLGTATDPLRIDPTGTTAQPITDGGGSITVDGPLTDTQLRATPVPISAASLPLPTGAATAALQTQPGVDIGDVTINNAAGAAAVNIQDGGNSITVDGPLTDAELRATAVSVSQASQPLPTGAATEATLLLVKAKTDNLDVALSTRATEATLLAVEADTSNLDVLLSTRATEATLALVKAKTDNLDVLLSTRAEKAQLPAALVGARLDTNVGAWLGATTPTVGQKAMTASIPVVLANNHSAVPVTFTPANARTGVSFANLMLGGATAGTLQVLRATTYTEPSSAAQRSVASSSASDAAAGTGARTLRLTYFDNTGVGPLTEDITLNGTTAVNTVATNIRFIESMVVLTDGSAGANVGTITLYSTTGGGGTVIGTIGIGTILPSVGDNRTLWAHHYVPTGWEVETAVLVAAVQSGGSGTSGKFMLRAAKPLIADSAEILLDGILLLPGSFSRSFDFHTRFPGFARITCYAIPSVNNAELAASFDWSEVPV